ncbi:MAG: hypothetical protein Q8Q23_00620 [bacterium]|nr:hypothetical protein [bacterium]
MNNIDKFLYMKFYLKLAKITLAILIIGLVFVISQPVEARLPDLKLDTAKLVKIADSPAVYAIINNQKHIIMNEEIFYSYDYNFANVRLISSEDLAKYQPVQLVKSPQSDRLYFLSLRTKQKKHHLNLEQFFAYPNNKMSDVVVISEKDFDYWSDTEVVKTADLPVVYYLNGDRKSQVETVDEFINAGFEWSKIIILSPKDLDTYITEDFDINAVNERRAKNESKQVDTALKDEVVNENEAGQVIVTLDSSSPKSKVIPYATVNNIVTTMRLRAVDGNVTINEIILSKSGLSDDAVVRSVFLEDTNGEQFGKIKPVTGHKVRIDLRNDPIFIPRNSQKLINIKVNFTNSATQNQSISFGIDSLADITTTANVSGVFPVAGSAHTLVAISGLLGEVELASKQLPISFVNTGANNELLTKFIIREISGNEDLAVQKITLKNYGTARDEDIDNLELYINGKRIAGGVSLKNGEAVFDSFDEFILGKEKEALVEVKGNIESGNGRTIKFVIEAENDIIIRSINQEFDINTGVNNDFPVGLGNANDFNQLSILTEGIGVFAVNVSAANLKVYREKSGSELALFELRNGNQDVYLQRIDFIVVGSGGAASIKKDIVIRDLTAKFNITNVEGERASNKNADVTLENYKIAANKTVRLQFLADIPKDAVSGSNYQVFINRIDYKVGLDNNDYSNAEIVEGQLRPVFAPALTVGKGKLASDLVEAGSDDKGKKTVELAHFVVTAGSDENIKITNLNFSLPTSSARVTYTGGFSNLSVYVGGSYRGRITEPNSDTFTFNNLSGIVSAGRSLDITIKADTIILAGDKVVQFKLDSIEGEGYSSHAPIIINGLPTDGVVSDPVTISKPAK